MVIITLALVTAGYVLVYRAVPRIRGVSEPARKRELCLGAASILLGSAFYVARWGALSGLVLAVVLVMTVASVVIVAAPLVSRSSTKR